ncbi:MULTISPECIES: hypothetical protein [unclassified Bradyrhizobium]|uniref:hypothetical protein n=1 Tax=unclassified Bradyrhizobium TaxID=2631580 RepID=UPI001FF73BA6|nr:MULTISPECIES: hypothetical protein [unclassified Bradyrhizobium]MCK1306848.1 hypothetical protein [Bradyrhizobium sp. 45]MCK1437143.1 hypothetical protein [Bradyrhizobium sp. 15]MCK1608565.1 hypothetical protein [Bradyrhizobium sp. 163]MCK1766337.1 hypothetical protein [Bradyrhizobium sp. 136]
MTFNVFAQTSIGSFYKAIDRWEDGYPENTFAYMAIKQGADFVLAQGMLWLNSLTHKTPLMYFETENVCAGHFKLADAGKTYREFISNLGAGTIVTPQRTLQFPFTGGANHHASFTPLHPSALQAQSRVNVLKITGNNAPLQAETSVLDWELRSAPNPYDTIAELLSEFGLGGLFTDKITVEVIATSVMGFNGDGCTISGETGTIVVQLANTLDRKNASVGYRQISQGKVVRGNLSGSQFEWEQTDEKQVGTYNIPVAKGSILHCYALYSGVAQTHWFITDPTTSQNPRRVVTEAFDGGLAILNEFLGRSRGKGRDARDLEVGVAWLFWMLGFGTVQFGSTARTQDFSDVVLVTPQGHMAIVECTTGLLRVDNKLPKLIARAADVRARLDRSNHGHVKLLPIMVSTLSRQELEADLDGAEKLGVLVLAREELDEAVNRTVISANPDELFATAEKEVDRLKAKARGNDEPELPLPPTA